MSDFKSRLSEEKTQLDERKSKLGSFLGTENFSKLPQVQQSLLNAQYGVMGAYSVILEERILHLD